MALIGRNGVEAFFGSPGSEAIGKTIQLNNNSYTVLGVLDDGMTGTNYCNIYMSKDTVLQDFSQGWEHLSSVVGLAREGVDIDAIQASTIEQVGQLKNIAEEDRESMISVWSMKSSIDQLDTFMMSFQLMMGSVAGISLLMGGIGIMNMMLTNIKERIREIGVRRALGARGRRADAGYRTGRHHHRRWHLHSHRPRLWLLSGAPRGKARPRRVPEVPVAAPMDEM